MALYKDIDFRTGGCLDSLGAIGTVTGTNFKTTELGLAFEGGASKYAVFDKQLLPDNAFSVVVWARLRYSHVLGSNVAAILSGNVTGSISTGGINLTSSDASIGKLLVGLGSSNYKYFNYAPDKKWHCFVITVPSSAQAAIDSAALFVDTLSKATNFSTSAGSAVARSNFIYTGGGNDASGGAMIARIKVYDTVIDTAQINREQEEFEQARSLTRQSICNYPMPNNTTLDLYENWKYLGINNKPQWRGEWIKGSGSYSVQHWVNRVGELIVNGDFSNGSAGWTLQTGWSVVDGKAVKVAGVGSNISQNKTELNKSYVVTFTISDYVAGTLTVQISGGGGGGGTARSANGTYTETIKSGITSPGNIFFVASSTFDGKVDNISVTEVYVKPNSFYLKCDTAGTLNIPFNKTSGLWEFEVLKGADANKIDIYLMADRINAAIGSSNSYYLSVHDSERLALNRSNTSTAIAIITGANGSISNNTWYKVRIYRLGNAAGKFPKRLTGDTTYAAWSWLLTVQGGSYANETVVVGNANDSVIQTSKYLIIDADVNDLIGDVKHFNTWSL